MTCEQCNGNDEAPEVTTQCTNDIIQNGIQSTQVRDVADSCECGPGECKLLTVTCPETPCIRCMPFISATQNHMNRCTELRICGHEHTENPLLLLLVCFRMTDGLWSWDAPWLLLP